MDDKPGPLGPRTHRKLWLLVWAIAILVSIPAIQSIGQPLTEEAGTVADKTIWMYFTPPMLIGLSFLLLGSAFFSASEVAFFSIHSVRLRSLSDSAQLAGRSVASMMQHPNRLLITILIGNMIVNVLISVFLPANMEHVFEHVFHVPPFWAYFLTVVVSTFILVFFGEIMPKVVAVRISETFAKCAVFPMMLFDRILSPVRIAVLGFTDFLFHITRFNDINAAPFITDDEFLSVLSDSEAQGVIEEEEEQMIQGILESGDSMLREILVPRPDMIAIEENANVKDALALFSEHEFSRMPVYKGNLDEIVGILFAKDLLTHIFLEAYDRPIKPLLRQANFVPSTMTIQAFMRDAQRKHMHLAIVADEFGGTEGIVTLEDAIEEIVGDIHDTSDEQEPPKVAQISEDVYRVDGSLPLDELSESIGVDLEEGSHETLAGFFIEHTHKIPEQGDLLNHNHVVLEVEEVDGKRASTFTLTVQHEAPKEEAS